MPKPKPSTITRHVDIYFEDGEMFVERANESMSVVTSIKDALAAVKQDDERLAKRKKAIVITKIAWHHLPAYMLTELK